MNQLMFEMENHCFFFEGGTKIYVLKSTAVEFSFDKNRRRQRKWVSGHRYARSCTSTLHADLSYKKLLRYEVGQTGCAMKPVTCG
jgi:hypothetical protein